MHVTKHYVWAQAGEVTMGSTREGVLVFPAVIRTSSNNVQAHVGKLGVQVPRLVPLYWQCHRAIEVGMYSPQLAKAHSIETGVRAPQKGHDRRLPRHYLNLVRFNLDTKNIHTYNPHS